MKCVDILCCLGKYRKRWSQLFFLGLDWLAVLAELSKRFIAESPWLYETAAVSSVYSRSPSAGCITTILLKTPLPTYFGKCSLLSANYSLFEQVLYSPHVEQHLLYTRLTLKSIYSEDKFLRQIEFWHSGWTLGPRTMKSRKCDCHLNTSFCLYGGRRVAALLACWESSLFSVMLLKEHKSSLIHWL